jgi:hypothetical protein
MRKILALILICAGLSVSAFAAGDYGTPGEFLSWGIGGEASGLGRAFTGLADDPSAVVYNPAGLAQQNPLQITLQHVALFYDTMFDFAAVTYPVSGVGTFAASYLRLGSTGYDSRDSNWNSSGTFGITDQAVILSYAKDLTPWLAGGLNLKLIDETVFAESGMGFGADIGFLATPNNIISIGLDLINIVPPSVKLSDTAESFPITMKLGFAFKFLGDRIIPLFDIEKEFTTQDLKFMMGVEAFPIQDLALRVGYDETEITFGAGYLIKPVKLDYSISLQTLGITNRATLTLAFGGFDINLKADPNIFSPVGVRKNTTISIYAVTKYPISEWELNIMNEDGDVVRTYSGDEKPPTSIVWDGKDDRGLPVSDGEYKLVMKVKDKNNASIESGKETVKVSSSIPMQQGTLKLEE